jgi:hypothetical protein
VGTSYIVDQTQKNADTTWKVSTWTHTSPTKLLVVEDVSWERPIIGARGSFRWSFNFGTRLWHQSDKVVFNIDAIVTSTTNKEASIIKCRVTTPSTQALWQNVKSCTLNLGASPPTVSLVPTAVLEQTLGTVRVNLDNVVTVAQATSSVKTVWGNVIFGGTGSGTTEALTKANTGTDITAPVDLTDARTVTPLLSKTYNLAGTEQDVEFNFTVPAALSDTGRVTIAFPSYYDHNLTTDTYSPACFIDNVLTSCRITSPRSLRFDDIALTATKAANTTLKIKVSGINAPQSYPATPKESFWVQVHKTQDDLESSVICAGAVADTVFASTNPGPIHVNWGSVSSTLTRGTPTSWTWVWSLLG